MSYTNYGRYNDPSSFYNSRPNFDRRRSRSRIVNLKGYNNWVKSVLIRRNTKENDVVLDLGGGKGGDLKKYKAANIKHLVLSDLAAVSIEHSLERYVILSKQSKRLFTCDFVVADSSKPELGERLEKLVDQFDVVSCQFSLHYTFSTPESANLTFKNMCRKLRPGGKLILTIPDADYIVKNVNLNDGKSFCGEDNIFQITFDKPDYFPNYGAMYDFYLEDAVENIPEYLIHFPTLVELAKLHNLELVLKKNFHEFYNDIKNEDVEKNEDLDLMTRLEVFKRSEFDKANWSACRLYLAVVFQKREDAPPVKKDGVLSSRHLEDKSVSKDDIMYLEITDNY